MQVVTYLHSRFHTPSHMPNAELRNAFDAAIKATTRCRASGMKCLDDSSAAENLKKLEDELAAERDRAVSRGFVDQEWFQKTVRWLVEWVPETEVNLIAALGRIARAKPL
ncbi:MAG TPA: hypothetical protein VF105_05340 [Gemmatimonadaceae bacterium]